MFNNIGRKIKTLASVVTCMGIIASIIGGFICLFFGALNTSFFLILLGLLIGFVGSIFSWISSFILYGLGQLVENTDKLVAMHNDYFDECSNSDCNNTTENSYELNNYRF